MSESAKYIGAAIAGPIVAEVIGRVIPTQDFFPANQILAMLAVDGIIAYRYGWRVSLAFTGGFVVAFWLRNAMLAHSAKAAPAVMPIFYAQ